MTKSEGPSRITGVASDAALAEWSQVEEDTRTPFIHKFQTERGRYIFDVNTSRILRVAPVVHDILDDLGRLTKDDILAQYRGRYAEADILTAFREIQQAQERDNLLLTKRPEHITMPYGEEAIQAKLMKERMILILSVTEDCNFRCRYCVYGGGYAHHRGHSQRVMDWDVARVALDDFLDHNQDTRLPSVNFYGGEPLLNMPLIRRCVAHVRQKARTPLNSCFCLTTNGSLLAGSTADFLAAEEFAIVVSLDGPAHLHDRNRRTQDGAPTWELVLANVRAFLQKYPHYAANGKLSFHVVAAPPINLVELEDFFGGFDLLTDKMGITLGWVSTQDGGYIATLKAEERVVQGYDVLYNRFITNLRSGFLNAHSQAASVRIQTALFQRTFLDFYKRGYSTDPLPDYFCPLPTCIPGVRRLFVTTEGYYYTCERGPEGEKMRIGSVREGIDITKIRQLLQRFVELAKDHCRLCWCLPTCRAGCMVTVTEGEDLSENSRRFACATHRNVTHRTMRDIARILEEEPHALDYFENIVIL
jgi:uncharacterized protein